MLPMGEGFGRDRRRHHEFRGKALAIWVIM